MNPSSPKGAAPASPGKPEITNRDLFLPYLAPYFAYVLIASFMADRIPIEWNYALRLIIVTSLLIWAWRWYASLFGPNSPAVSVLIGIVAGIIGCVLWVVMLAPFVDVHSGEGWSSAGFYLRLIAASTIVPIFEEIFIRGYIFRIALQWGRARTGKKDDAFRFALDESCLDDVAPGDWSLGAVAISTVAFSLGHAFAEWPAAVGYGLLMCWLWILRKDLLSCVVAHATTNFILAFYVRTTGSWGLW